MDIKRISFIGSGNVATHLAVSLNNVGIDIFQVFSRNYQHAAELAKQVNAQPITHFQDLKPVDALLISIPDDAIIEVVNSLSAYKGLVVHTSGITGLTEFERERMGYMYPLQSFRKEQKMNVNNIPFYVEAKHKDDQEALIFLAEKISKRVEVIGGEQKKQLHLAAVILNNFVNHLFGLTNEYLSGNLLDFEALQPLINMTVERALNENPYYIQTGPALRRDEQTMRKHLKMLQDYTALQKIYVQLSESIQQKHEQLKAKQINE